MFSYNHVRLWEAGSGEQGVLIPLGAMLPTRTSPADSSLPFNNSTSLTDVIDASTGTVWAPSPRTTILPRYYRMLWEHLGNYPNSLLGWPLCPRCRGGSYPEHSARAGGVCIICCLWRAGCALGSRVNSPALSPPGAAASQQHWKSSVTHFWNPELRRT